MKAIDPLTVLLQFRDRYRTLTEAAAALDISKQYLSDMLLNRRDISPNVLAKIGLKRRVLIERAS